MPDSDQAAIQIAHLGREGGDPEGLSALTEEFSVRNAGYSVSWTRACEACDAATHPRALFITRGEAGARITSSGAEVAGSEVAVGDLLWLRPGEELTLDAACSMILFTVPGELPEGLPSVIRPDHDPQITDTPGGCAEEERAYRRILVTWLADNGPYTFDGLNAHRVRMWNSFSHYHPPDGGFDELYIVEDVEDGGRIHTSLARERIESPEDVGIEEVSGLVQTLTPEPGDLIYIPRGVIHRAVGGVLAQVVTVPGFKPGFEIGVDHHLRAINERLGLAGAEALPFQEAASAAPLIK